MSHGRPRLATWILSRCAPEYRRDSFLGDLIEQYDSRGRWWYWRQTLGAVWSYSLRRLVSANQADVSAAEYVSDLVTAISLSLFACIHMALLADLVLVLLHSKSGRTVADTLIGAACLAAVAVAHLVRARAAAAPREGDRPHI